MRSPIREGGEQQADAAPILSGETNRRNRADNRVSAARGERATSSAGTSWESLRATIDTRIRPSEDKDTSVRGVLSHFNCCDSESRTGKAWPSPGTSSAVVRRQGIEIPAW